MTTLTLATATQQERQKLSAPITLGPTFDLTLVRNHMIRRHELDDETADLAEAEYRGYLQKCKANPGQAITPGHIADKFWHAHILHTKLYMTHCMEYLGYYLHHTPKPMPTDVPCALGECFCNGDGPQLVGQPANGGGIDFSMLKSPTESCGPTTN